MPRELRDRLRLVGGETVELIEHDGVIEITVVPAEVDLVETPEGIVLRPRHPMPPLSDEIVREALDRIRR